MNSQVIERGLQSQDALPLLVADMQQAREGTAPRKAVNRSHAHKPDQSQDRKVQCTLAYVHLLHAVCEIWLRIFLCPQQIALSPEKQSDAKLIEVLDCSQYMHR